MRSEVCLKQLQPLDILCMWCFQQNARAERAVHHSWKLDRRYLVTWVCSKEKPRPWSLYSQAMKKSSSVHFLKAFTSLLKYLIERYCLTVESWSKDTAPAWLTWVHWGSGVLTVKAEWACGDARYLVSQITVLLRDPKKKKVIPRESHKSPFCLPQNVGAIFSVLSTAMPV